MESEVMKYIKLVIGSLLFPVSVNLFISPVSLNAGGIVGMAQIINYLIPISYDLTGVINLAFNIPLFILAFRSISKNFCFKTLVSLLVQTIGFSIIPVMSEPIMNDVLSNALIGAVIGGFGVGLCLQSSGSSGGLDILGVYFSKTRPNFSVGKLSYAVNAFVLGISAYLFDLQVALYSIIFIIVMYYVCDHIHYQNISLQTLIFTKNPELKEAIMKRVGRGVTYWEGYGAYTNSSREVLACIINKYEVRRIKKIVHDIDPNAFVTISEVSMINGNFEKRI